MEIKEKEGVSRQEEKALKRWKEDLIDLTSYVYRCVSPSPRIFEEPSQMKYLVKKEFKGEDGELKEMFLRSLIVREDEKEAVSN